MTIIHDLLLFLSSFLLLKLRIRSKKEKQNVALMTFWFAIVPVFDRFNLIALVQAHIKILVVRQLR
ncbi:MAG TPA: hypothetical protein PK034_08525 [Rugosibacter sp.]|nr:hypothetical protein [Rugosibacter sp.]